MAVTDLCFDEAAAQTWTGLAATVGDALPCEVPAGTELAEVLSELTVPYDAVAAALSVAGRLDADQREFLRVTAAAVLRWTTGPIDGQLPPTATETTFGRLAYLLLYASLAPSIHELHRELGIPEQIGRTTLADLGRHAFVYGKRYGATGFDKQNWMTLHFTGRLYQLGRLQFERTTAGGTVAASARAAGLTVNKGDPVLSVHIPRFLGPLTVIDCDASIAAAGEFFAKCFPAERPSLALCASWLLDPQLAQHLDPRSNILAFQRRFTAAAPPEIDDVSAVEFTFDEPDLPLSRLPRTSQLERAVIDVLAGGGHWHSATGWFRW